MFDYSNFKIKVRLIINKNNELAYLWVDHQNAQARPQDDQLRKIKESLPSLLDKNKYDRIYN